MIGIGITSYNRPEVLKVCYENILKYTSNLDTKIHIAIDSDEDRKGIAFRKNECLRSLKDCENIFLFDDDCFPKKHNWHNHFIDSGKEHLLYMNRYNHQYLGTKGNVEVYGMCGGAFMYMTNKSFQRVGAFNEKFNIYGFEHAEYSNRIYGRKNHYEMLKDTEKYIECLDYSDKDHKSSIADIDKVKYVKENWDKYFNEPQETFISL